MLANAQGRHAPGRKRCWPSAAAGPAIPGEVAGEGRASGRYTALITRTFSRSCRLGAKLGANGSAEAAELQLLLLAVDKAATRPGRLVARGRLER